jgi:hypothetical protein
MRSAVVSPLLGFNNNFRHKGRTFHIQTEDSGLKHPHIISHLFMDGGRIVKSVKTSYAEHVNNERVRDIVKEMMKQQHKAMMIALRDGQFDEHIAQIVSGAASMRPPVPSSPPSVPGTSGSAPPRGEPSAHRAVSSATPRPSPPSGLQLDLTALSASAKVEGARSGAPVSELPPPPENLFRDRTATGRHRAVQDPTLNAERDPSPSAPVVGGDGPPPVRPRQPSISDSASATAPVHRYASARPPPIFAPAGSPSAKPDEARERSLDEVILSFLAEDFADEESR